MVGAKLASCNMPRLNGDIHWRNLVWPGFAIVRCRDARHEASGHETLTETIGQARYALSPL